MRAVARHAATIGLTRETVLAAASGLLDGRLDPATWREQLTIPVKPADPDKLGELADGEGWPPPAPAGVALRPGTKQALIARLLEREHGATLDELRPSAKCARSSSVVSQR